jgi:hypothetical protein
MLSKILPINNKLKLKCWKEKLNFKEKEIILFKLICFLVKNVNNINKHMQNLFNNLSNFKKKYNF